MSERFAVHYTQLLTGMAVTSCPDMKQVVAALTEVQPTIWGAVPRVWEKAKTGIESQLTRDSWIRRTMVEQAMVLSAARVRARQQGTDLDPVRRGLHAIVDRVLLARLRARIGLGHCRFAMLGGVGTPREVLEFFAALGLSLSEVYGMTEMSGFTTVNPIGRIRYGTVGLPVPGVQTRLAADGELLMRGEFLMRGYRGEPAKTAEAIDANGWLHTGDIAGIDTDGYLRIIDRKKELIINAAGKNMSPANIEAALTVSTPLISQAVAIGDGRPYNVALLVLDPDAAVDFADRCGIPGADIGALADHPAVRSELERAVAQANTRLARVEQIKRYAVPATAWEPGSDELTPKGTLKRRAIAEKYAAMIESLYATEGAGR